MKFFKRSGEREQEKMEKINKSIEKLKREADKREKFADAYKKKENLEKRIKKAKEVQQRNSVGGKLLRGIQNSGIGINYDAFQPLGGRARNPKKRGKARKRKKRSNEQPQGFGFF